MNVNKCYNSFIDKIISAINKSTTIKTSNSKHKHLKEWMSTGLLNSVRRKNALSLKVKKHPNNEKLRSYYIKYKNNFTNILRTAKINFYKKKFNEISYSPKLTRKMTKEITIKKRNEDKIELIRYNNENIYSSKDPMRVSNVFDKFFTNIGSNLANKIKQSNLNYNEINTSESFDMYFKEIINDHEIIKIISNLKDDTAAGYDGVSVKILKSISSNIIKPLTYIYNLSLKEGKFLII